MGLDYEVRVEFDREVLFNIMEIVADVNKEKVRGAGETPQWVAAKTVVPFGDISWPLPR